MKNDLSCKSVPSLIFIASLKRVFVDICPVIYVVVRCTQKVITMTSSGSKHILFTAKMRT